MNILLVGPGGMGTVHYLNYAHVPGAKVVALVGGGEGDEARAKEWGLALYSSTTEACAKEQVELVDLCVPTYLHKTLVLESLAQGKHTIVEKPVALRLQDAREMFQAAEERGLQLYVAQVLQFTREVEILHEAVASGRYGKPIDGCFERLSARPQWSRGGWLSDPQKSGGVAFDLHIHDLDVIVSLFGKPETVRLTRCGNPACPAQYRFTYGFADGLNVSAEAAWLNACIPFTARWRVCFERGALVCDHTGLHGYDDEGHVETFDVEEKIKIPTGINLPPTEMFLNELAHFVKRAEENRPSEKVPKEQVLRVLETVERALGE